MSTAVPAQGPPIPPKVWALVDNAGTNGVPGSKLPLLLLLLLLVSPLNVLVLGWRVVTGRTSGDTFDKGRPPPGQDLCGGRNVLIRGTAAACCGMLSSSDWNPYGKVLVMAKKPDCADCADSGFTTAAAEAEMMLTFEPVAL